MFSSTNNFALKKLNFFEVKNIKITGLDTKSKNILLDDIKRLNLENIFFINGKEIGSILNSNTLIEKYNISKKYPSTLNVKVTKAKFLAKMNNNGKIFFIGSNGKLSKGKFFEENLPFVFGNPKIKEFLKIKKIIDESSFSYDQIENLYFFQSKRWDLELKNKIFIKLSKDNMKDSLNYAFKFINHENITDNKILDLRVKNQIILHE